MFGVIEPGGYVIVDVKPPIKDNERPMVLTPDSRDLLLENVAPAAVQIRNLNGIRIVGYVLVIVPSIVANAAVLPWRKIATDLGHAINKEGGVIDQIKRLFGADPTSRKLK